MSDTIARGKLARVAAGLRGVRGGLPRLFLVTDSDVLGDLAASVGVLPPGSGILLRERDQLRLREMGHTLLELTRARGHFLLIAGDEGLALEIGAHGLHLPQIRWREAGRMKLSHPDWVVTASAHNASELRQADAGGADAAFLAPIFKTLSHPEREALGVFKARTLSAAAQIPVYGLGGIHEHNVGRLAGARLAGLAAVRALLA